MSNPRLQAILSDIPLFRGSAGAHALGDIVRIWNPRSRNYVIAQVVLQRHGTKITQGLFFLRHDADFDTMLRKQRALQLKNARWPTPEDPDFHAKVQRILLEHGIEPKPLGYVDPQACKRQPKKIELDVHQRIVANCLVFGPYQGVIAAHSLGSGKSCSAIATMNQYMALREALVDLELMPSTAGPHVLFVIPPRDSLIENMRAELGRCPGFMRDHIEARGLTGAALSAYINKNILVTTYVSLANKLEKKQISLDDKLILMDEAHNFLYPEPQYRKKYDLLYEHLLKAKNKKLLLMTATPIFRSITDLARLANLCLPADRPKMPITEDAFRSKYFRGHQLKDNSLEMDLRGVISFFNQENDPSYFARRSLMRPEVVETSEDHFKRWKETAEKEIKVYKATSPEAFDELDRSPVFKDGMRKLYKGSSEVTNYPYRSYKSKGIWTPKFDKLLFNLELSPRSKHVVFSRHLEAGVRAIGSYLESKGWVRMSNNKSDKVTAPPKQYNPLAEQLEKAGVLKPLSAKAPEEQLRRRRDLESKHITKPQYGFIVLNKDTTQAEIARCREIFNAPENAEGKWARVIVLDEKFFEGVSLLQTNHVHLFEPLPNYQSERQAIARAIRRCSHASQEWPWEVKVYKYFHEYQGVPMTDTWMQKYNEHNKRIIEAIFQSVEKSSFEYGFAKFDAAMPETVKQELQRKLTLLERIQKAFSQPFRRGTPEVKLSSLGASPQK